MKYLFWDFPELYYVHEWNQYSSIECFHYHYFETCVPHAKNSQISPFRWYQANLVSSNLPSCPSVRLLRGVCHLDIPKEIGEERSLDVWLANEILPGERYPGKRIHVLLCDGQMAGMRLVPKSMFMALRIFPVWRDEPGNPEGGGFFPHVRFCGRDDPESYVNRVDYSFATEKLRTQFIGESGYLCQVVMEG